jgi:hypothetical protein
MMSICKFKYHPDLAFNLWKWPTPAAILADHGSSAVLEIRPWPTAILPRRGRAMKPSVARAALAGERGQQRWG